MKELVQIIRSVGLLQIPPYICVCLYIYIYIYIGGVVQVRMAYYFVIDNIL
jgi:hypothetical protein